MMQVRPVFVREAALLLAELAQKAEAGDGFVRALDGEGQAGAGPDGLRTDGLRTGDWRTGDWRTGDWERGPAAIRRPQPDRATGFMVHASQPEGPERAAAPAALAAYAARLAERVVIEGPVAAFSLRV